MGAAASREGEAKDGELAADPGTSPTAPINHYFGPGNQRNRTKILFHYSMLMYSSNRLL